MRTTKIDPWTWQDDFGFTQASRLDGVGSVVLLSGQTGVDADGGSCTRTTSEPSAGSSSRTSGP
jgi:hypothetical protein